MFESPDLSVAEANFLHENQDLKWKMIIWMRGYSLPYLENHITPLWVTSELLNLGNRPSFSLKRLYYLEVL